MNQQYYDHFETRDPEQRIGDLGNLLPRQVAYAKSTADNSARLDGIDPEGICSITDLRLLPILRKSQLGVQRAANRDQDPFAGYSTCECYGTGADRRARAVAALRRESFKSMAK